MRRFAIIATLIVTLLGFGSKASAQFFSDIPEMQGKFIYGGDIGFGLYNNFLDLSLSPHVGYCVLDPLEVGLRGTYKLQCIFAANANSLYFHYFGVAPYVSFQFYKGLFLHVEDEVLYGMSRYHHETAEQRWFNTLFAGGGYKHYTNRGRYIFIMALYNFSWENPENWNEMYPYYSPLEIRLGFCF